MPTCSPPRARECRPKALLNVRHGDNFHESLVLVRAWGDAYLMGFIAGRHHQREPCRQYLSVVLANLCNFAQEREREEDLLENGA